MKINQLPCYWRTLRHLKLIQFTNRVRRNCFHPTPDLSAAPELREKPTSWNGCVLDSGFFENCFTSLHHTAEIVRPEDWNRSDCSKLWLYNLHYFDFLRSAGKEGIGWLQRWIVENPPGFGNGWEPYPLSLRIVNWIKYDWRGQRLPPEAVASLAIQLRFLSKLLEYHLLANHLLANAKALIFGGTFFGGKEGARWLRKGWQIYREQLPEQLLDDGGHFERSLMYHSIIIEDLLDVRQATGDEWLNLYIEKMLAFFAAFIGPDGKIALFNDAAFNIVPTPQQLFEYAEQLGFPLPLVPQNHWFSASGYWRSRRGRWTIFVDAAPIGPDYQPGHAHADTFSFELFLDDQRIVVDSGTSGYQTERRSEERGTAAHNTLRLDGRDSSEVWGAHRVGRRARVSGCEELSDGFTAIHDGYKPVLHRRSWHWQNDQTLRIEDELYGSGYHELQLGWHFHPTLSVVCRAPGEIMIGKHIRLIYPPGLQLEISDSLWGAEFGKLIPNRKLQLCYKGKIPVKLPVTITVLT